MLSNAKAIQLVYRECFDCVSSVVNGQYCETVHHL